MIQPAILPVSAQLLLAIDPQAEAAGAGGMESPFSALLDAKIDAGLAALGTAAAPGTAKDAAIRQTAGPASGKPGGKILPDRGQIAAGAVPETAGDTILPGADAPQAEIGADGEGGPAIDSALLTVLPAIVPLLTAVPFAAPARVAEPAGSTPDQPGPPQPVAVPAAAPLIVRTPGQRLLANLTAASGDQLPADAAAAGLPTDRASQVPAAVAVVSAQAAQAMPLAQAFLVPTRLSGSDVPAVSPDAISQAAERAETAAAPLAVQPQSARKLGRETRDVISRAEASAPVAASETSRPSAALVQPEALPQLVLSQTASAPAAPAIAAPLTAPVQHDFAALIDRLVEARQAAQASLAVQTVIAAVTHAEFGQVSLHFRQDAEGLSVVMAGTDPDLARAVQVAAPAAQTGTQTSGNDNHAATRQDSTSQPQAQNQTHSQQQRGQSPQHRADDPRGSANSSPRQRSQDDSSARGGIFA